MKREHVHAPMRPVEADVDATDGEDPILLASRWQTAGEGEAEPGDGNGEDAHDEGEAR